MTVNITVTNRSIYYISVIFMGCLVLNVDRVWKWKFSAVYDRWAAPVGEDVITIGVERKSRPLITPL